jgi:hypothetical protein
VASTRWDGETGQRSVHQTHRPIRQALVLVQVAVRGFHSERSFPVGSVFGVVGGWGACVGVGGCVCVCLRVEDADEGRGRLSASDDCFVEYSKACRHSFLSPVTSLPFPLFLLHPISAGLSLMCKTGAVMPHCRSRYLRSLHCQPDSPAIQEQGHSLYVWPFFSLCTFSLSLAKNEAKHCKSGLLYPLRTVSNSLSLSLSSLLSHNIHRQPPLPFPDPPPPPSRTHALIKCRQSWEGRSTRSQTRT